MEQLGEQIDSVVAHCEIDTFYGIGAGAGVSSRFPARALATDLSIFVALSRIRVLPHPPRELTVLRAGAYVHGRMLLGR